MTKAAKVRALLLLLAVFTTLLALTPPRPAQACLAYEIDSCQEANGTWCQWSDCAALNHCSGTLHNCSYQRVTCCPA